MQSVLQADAGCGMMLTAWSLQMLGSWPARAPKAAILMDNRPGHPKRAPKA